MKIIDIKKQLQILDNYNMSALMSLEEIDNSNQYTQIIFSIFDHWLTEKEYVKKIVSYNEIKFSTNQNIKDIYTSYENKFLKLYNSLYHEYDIFLILNNLAGRVCFCNFNSNEEYIEIIKNGIRDQFLFSIFIPELESIFSSGDDFTHYINIQNTNNLHLNKLATQDIIKKNKLFALNFNDSSRDL